MNTCPACLSPAPDGAKHCPTCGQSLASSALPMALPKGSVLQGKYRIEGAIGQGGFGITYKAVHLGLGQNVAIKEYFPDVASRTPGSTHVT